MFHISMFNRCGLRSILCIVLHLCTFVINMCCNQCTVYHLLVKIKMLWKIASLQLCAFGVSLSLYTLSHTQHSVKLYNRFIYQNSIGAGFGNKTLLIMTMLNSYLSIMPVKIHHTNAKHLVEAAWQWPYQLSSYFHEAVTHAHTHTGIHSKERQKKRDTEKEKHAVEAALEPTPPPPPPGLPMSPHPTLTCSNPFQLLM